MNGAYVIQFHQSPAGDHYDFMLEMSDALATFQLSTPLEELAADQPVDVVRLPDHRRLYLRFEGEISGGRGRVHIVDKGRYQADHADEALWIVALTDGLAAGRYELRRIEGHTYRLTRFKTPAGT